MIRKRHRILSIIITFVMVLSLMSNFETTKVKASGGYNSSAAVEYARRYSCNHNKYDNNIVVNDGCNCCKCSYNPDFVSYPDNDCANFVSQCLVAGGLPVNETWGIWQTPAGIKGTAAWNTTDGLLNYFKNNSAYSDLVIQNPSKSDLIAGNPIWITTGHVALCTSDGSQYCAHTNSRKDASISFSVVYTVRLDLLGGQVSDPTPTNNPGEPYPIPTRNISRGTSGDDVKWVQKFANDIMGAGIAVDGISGDQTVNVIRQFQSQYGLTVDGIAGTQTINKMLEVWRGKTQDTTPPTISNAKVTSITSSGYTVEVDITDNIGVAKVEFPSWPKYKSSNGCTWYSPTSVSGNHYTFKLSFNDFNKYSGEYCTHIYAWDAAGNKKNVSLNNIGPLTMSPAYTAISGNSKYEVYNAALRWTDAKEFAESKGGHLITITSSDEMERFNKVINSGKLNINGKQAYWIGYTDEKSEGTFRWITGESGNYINYRSGQPDNGSGDEDYVGIWKSDLKWNDFPDDFYTYVDGDVGFIIEYDGYVCSHAWIKGNTINPSCVSRGTQEYICSLCGITVKEDIEATGHSWDSGKVTKAATCTEKGIKTYTCSKCAATKKEDIAVTGHKPITDAAVVATCVKDGKTEGSHCSVCGTIIKAQQTVKATGHSWDSGKITKAATCTTDGVKTLTCSRCKTTKTESIRATGHNWNSGKTTKAATCTAKGVKSYTCTKCNSTKTEEIPATGHKPVSDAAVVATCTKAGKTAGSHCSVCGTVITAQQTIPATGHSWDSGKVTKQPTTSSTGIKTYTCTKCKATKTETIPKLTVSNKPGVSYTTHIQSIGWQEIVRNGDLAGTVGDGKRLEAIKINLENAPYSGGIEYRTHVQTYGWQGWVENGALSGTSGQAKRLEAIQIRLTGEMAKHYDVYYRIQVQSFGWLGWAKNGEYSGSAGYAKRLEAIQIVLVEKGKSIDRATLNKQGKITSSTKVTDDTPYVAKAPSIHYQTHVQSYGWQDFRKNGEMSGTSGQAKRLEGIRINLSKPPYEGGVRYKTHVQTYGWQGWSYDGTMSGTSGQAKRLEAICIELTGEMAEHYDVYYRVHAQSYGWLGWAKNGQNAGTAGYAKRLEGIQIVLVEKGKLAPGKTYNGITASRNESYISK